MNEFLSITFLLFFLSLFHDKVEQPLGQERRDGETERRVNMMDEPSCEGEMVNDENEMSE